MNGELMASDRGQASADPRDELLPFVEGFFGLDDGVRLAEGSECVWSQSAWFYLLQCLTESNRRMR